MARSSFNPKARYEADAFGSFSATGNEPERVTGMVASAEYDPVVVEALLTAAKVQELIELGRESAKLDYKRSFDLTSTRDAVELTKDAVAMANTAGGYIVLGVEDDGGVVGFNPGRGARLDEATLRKKVGKFIGVGLELFVGNSFTVDEKPVTVVTILKSAHSPIVFVKSGQYTPDGGKRSIDVFRSGDVFVRHGSASECWNQNDVATIYARVVEREKERWLREVLPDIKRALADGLTDSVVMKRGAIDLQELLTQDAEAFEHSLRSIIRRLP